VKRESLATWVHSQKVAMLAIRKSVLRWPWSPSDQSPGYKGALAEARFKPDSSGAMM